MGKGKDEWVSTIYCNSFTMPPYSTWNPCGTDLFHVESKESTWNMFYHINHVLTDMESTWNPCPFHMDLFYMDSIWSLCGVYVESMWIPCGMHLISQLILKSGSKF